MKKIAIITPCILPVPCTSGGAVESLITKIITDNEINNNFDIDLFTISSNSYCDYSFSSTNIININDTKSSRNADKLLDKVNRTFKASKASRALDDLIVKVFYERLNEIECVYDAVIIENMMSTACEIARICKNKYDCPVYFHMHNDVDMYRSPLHINELVKNGVQFIAVSHYIKNQILKCNSNAKVSVLYNGIDFGIFKPPVKSDNDRVRLLYAGRIIPDKGVKELVLAFISVLNSLDEDKKDKISLKIVGFSGFDKGYEKDIFELVKNHSCIDCRNQVNADEMSSIYSDADIVIMPSKCEEAFGLAAFETMAMGLPIITTNSGAIPELAGDGAYIIDKSGNLVQNLSDAILKIAFNKNFKEELSQIAISRIKEKSEFNLADYYSNFSNIIKGDEISSDDTISVIVPVYNTSKYLSRCVESIINQTYSNWEMILVDDGSTDNSGNICDEYTCSDSRIKVIHQENRGLSGARNKGIDEATGKYIFFCDSDDYLRNDCLEKLIVKLKLDRADIVACGIFKTFENKDPNLWDLELFTAITPGRWSGPESVIEMMRGNSICTVAWNKLYKKELFDGIRFPENFLNEDEATTYKLLYKAGIVSYTPEALYNYFQRESSIMHDDFSKRYGFFIDILKERITFFKEKGENVLEQHSRITLLEWIKYSYRNIGDRDIKARLVQEYRGEINFANAPSVLGFRKKLALFSWKYFRY